ncbi:MAG: RNA polymerase sigma factor [Candidatus Obscuribacterales bacterium]|nr:RNA polymerase sigma factor [Candidatus Obscuribacterales bacterium]
MEKFRQTKDPNLFKSLVRRYQTRVYNAAYRILGNAEEAEDVVQDTCIKLHQNINKFNRNCTFAAWLFRIAHNTCLDILRAKQRKKVAPTITFDPQFNSDTESVFDTTSVISQAADPSPNPAEALEFSEQNEVIAQKLQELPDIQRTVVVLHDIEGFSYQEIAEIVGTSLGTVRSRLHYGRSKLRELLDAYYSSGPVSPASR